MDTWVNAQGRKGNDERVRADDDTSRQFPGQLLTWRCFNGADSQFMSLPLPLKAAV